MNCIKKGCKGATRVMNTRKMGNGDFDAGIPKHLLSDEMAIIRQRTCVKCSNIYYTKELAA